MAKQVILVAQIFTGILLIGLVLLQGKGGGLGTAFGGSGGVYQSKRGVERIMLITTVIVAALFLALSIASVS
ncbi:preprotein translocase subunit SecG [Candidatus Shapirobacteria bacterium CG09_land_8_20_14_0_10_49_15]|uniref:Protein-export membrane protein SecG n=1 Tax=Candidatus Shapirobacteria bacterium CG09_land_8_20_14_0_10_49_15 TaxID=1974482 RepID=A0A2M6XBL6_9BACT|nr:MAG: preprotein translocase subunit SecG [Candidatus Shapirobacteria bacterium CG09_land_8_20_14_0_10_49_15]